VANAINNLEKLQYGLETVAGTLVAADTIMLAEQGGEFTDEVERVAIEEPRGVLAMVEDVDVRKGSLLTYTQAMDYESSILMPLLTGIKQTTPAAGPPKVWTFLPSMVTPETLDSATWEVAYTDGTTKHVEREFGFGTTRKFTITFGFNQVTKITTEIFGRASQTSTLTASQAALSRTVIPSNLWKVYIDTSWAGLGGTQKSGLIRSGTLEIITGADVDYTLDGRADIDFTQLMRGMITGSLQLTMAVDANFSTELTAWRAKTMRFIQLIATAGANNIVEIDVAGIYTSPPSYSVDRGLRVADLTLDLRYDPTSSKVFQAIVTNSVAAL
jgi:hypothetical protein